jgi:hypothetical protein
MRDLSTEMQAVATADVIRPILLVECDFDSGDLNLWNGVGNLTYGGKTYVGAGTLLNVSSVQETVDLKANGLTVTLSGISGALVDQAKTEDYQGRSLVVKLGAMDESNDVIASPEVMFAGFMDTMKITETGETSSITVNVENKLIAFERAKVRRFTDADQKIDHPTDKGFEFVTSIQEKEIVWGKTQTASGSGVGSPFTGYTSEK